MQNDDGTCCGECVRRQASFSYVEGPIGRVFGPSRPTDTGRVSRRFRSVYALKAHLGVECPSTMQKSLCEKQECAVNCELTKWASWSDCYGPDPGTKCGVPGERQRARRILKAQVGGGECAATLELESCQLPACQGPVCASEWAKWSECTGTGCEESSRTRTRTLLATADPQCTGVKLDETEKGCSGCKRVIDEACYFPSPAIVEQRKSAHGAAKLCPVLVVEGTLDIRNPELLELKRLTEVPPARPRIAEMEDEEGVGRGLPEPNIADTGASQCHMDMPTLCEAGRPGMCVCVCVCVCGGVCVCVCVCVLCG